MLTRFFGIVKKEFSELIKDRLYLTFVFFVPLIVLFMLGYGLNFDVKGLPVSFLDYDRSKLSREYINSFVNSEYFKLYALVDNYEEAFHLMYLGLIRAIIVIPQDFSQKLYKGERAEVQILVDGTYPSRAEVVMGYLTAINALFNQKLREGKDDMRPPFEIETRVWYNPGLESKNFIMPGMLVTTLCFYPVILACLLVVREKELGSILNYYASPAKRWEVILGKAIPYVFVSFLTYLLLFLITVFVFKAKFIGNFLVLSLAGILYLFCTVGLGLFISTITKTQITAMLLAFVTTVIPSFLYSGFLYPVSSMEFSGRLISRIIPATYFLDIVRGMYLKGLPISYLLPNLFSLFIYALIVYTATILNFRKRM